MREDKIDFIVGVLILIVFLLLIFDLKNNLDDMECVEYGTKVVTKRRIIAFTPTYDTYEEEYCKEYKKKE